MARIGPRSPDDAGTPVSGERGETYLDIAEIGRSASGSSSASGENGAAGSGNDGESNRPDGSGTPKRRGRPPGSKNKTSETVSVGKRTNVDAFAYSLSGIHATLAMVFQAPEIALDKERAEYVAKSYANFARHYEWLEASEKTMDTGALIVCVSVVYLPMILAVSARRRAEKQARRQGLQPAVVVQAPGSGPANKTPPPATSGAKPTGATPFTRPSKPEDTAMLDEVALPMPTFN